MTLAAMVSAPAAESATAAAPRSAIRHVVVIVQENHSLVSHFATYCAQSRSCNTAGGVADDERQQGVVGLIRAGIPAMRSAKAAGGCALTPVDCPAHVPNYPCVFDPSGVPAEHFPDQADQPTHIRDYNQLAADVTAHALPAVSFIKGLGYCSEHSGYGDTISDGVRFVSQAVNAITRNVPDASVLLT